MPHGLAILQLKRSQGLKVQASVNVDIVHRFRKEARASKFRASVASYCARRHSLVLYIPPRPHFYQWEVERYYALNHAGCATVKMAVLELS